MAGKKTSDLPPHAEKRPQRRVRVLLGGRVTFLDGAQYFDCTIRDLTRGGARIALPKNQPMPSHVYLINMRDRVAYEARVAWNSGAEAGLEFLKTMPLSGLTNTKLSYLKRLWHERAMR